VINFELFFPKMSSSLFSLSVRSFLSQDFEILDRKKRKSKAWIESWKVDNEDCLIAWISLRNGNSWDFHFSSKKMKKDFHFLILNSSVQALSQGRQQSLPCNPLFLIQLKKKKKRPRTKLLTISMCGQLL
jgi:hypothetical protein